jgi:beta-lactamase superfamily II metal-dependent hydrolase
MGYEIDFLAVGTESRGGDAIALRYGNLYGPSSDQTVIVIDGGYTECGEAMVEHIRRYYGTDEVDMVVSSHPDMDHVTGLEVVVEEMTVGQLLMHQPWRHSSHLAQARDGAFKSASVSDKLAKSLQDVSDLEDIANRKGVAIIEPWAGMTTDDGCFKILGPTPAFYEEILALEQTTLSSIAKGLVGAFSRVKDAVTTVFESPTHETLRDGGITSPQNNSSVISTLRVGGDQILFTADAGAPALEGALAILESDGFTPGSLTIAQVPHHGSRRNVGPTILNRLLGPIGQLPGDTRACVSAPAKNPEAKHPAKKVTNAFLRRGYPVFATQGKGIRFYNDAPARPGWNTISTAVPFYNYVEEDSEQ